MLSCRQVVSIFYTALEICEVLRKLGRVQTHQRNCLVVLSGWDSQPQKQSSDTCRGAMEASDKDAPELDPSSATKCLGDFGQIA